MEKIRSFMCIEIKDQSILDKIINFQNDLKFANIKFVERENIHFTFKFFGDITKPIIDKIISLMENVEGEPFKVSLEKVGVFPKLQFPRVIWVGASEGAEKMIQLYNQLNPNFVKLGFKKERPYSPHATIGRVRSGKNKAQLIKKITEFKDFKFGIMDIKSFQLKKSVLTRKGPIYTIIKETFL
ncbi:MAG: RNA 2',3'-cyclic phosphodiesterase [Candidatus Helarchaeota archaeon]|nr:RNA 2',3'-cyclic phosphodiesterase [Candidatus Helarchaeota archaeon]